MTTLVMILVLLLALTLGLTLQVCINRSIDRAGHPRPILPPPDPTTAFEYGLHWVAADGQIYTSPPVTAVGEHADTPAGRRAPAVEGHRPPAVPTGFSPAEVDELRRAAHKAAGVYGELVKQSITKRPRRTGIMSLVDVDEHEHERARTQAVRDEWLRLYCRPATAADYAEFLRRWLAAGRQTTYDYSRDLAEMWIVRPDVMPTTPPECSGAASFQVIIPAGHDWPPAAVAPRRGHSSFYWVDYQGAGPTAVGHFVPTYADVRAILAGQ